MIDLRINLYMAGDNLIPKISIILPNYNSEKYLKCLDTLFELFSWYNQDSKSLWRKYEIKYSRNS